MTPMSCFLDTKIYKRFVVARPVYWPVPGSSVHKTHSPSFFAFCSSGSAFLAFILHLGCESLGQVFCILMSLPSFTYLLGILHVMLLFYVFSKTPSLAFYM